MGSSPLPFSFCRLSATQQELELKTTEYFKHLRKRPDRAIIQDEWITDGALSSNPGMRVSQRGSEQSWLCLVG